jgi:hypothetical protein
MTFKQDDRPIKTSKEFSERMREASARESEPARAARRKEHPEAFAPRSASAQRRRR